MEAIVAIMVQLLVVSLPLVIYYLVFMFFANTLQGFSFKEAKTPYDYVVMGFSAVGFFWTIANIFAIIYEFRGHI